MIIRRLIHYLLLLTATSTILCACGEEEPDNPYDPGSNPNLVPYLPAELDVKQIIKNNVKVVSSYSDYSFTFVITSTLQRALPVSYSIEYGVGHASVSFTPTYQISVGSQAYSYKTSTKGSVQTITFENPFWFYYVMNGYQEKWNTCELYYKSYVELKNKGINKLSSDERELYREITNYLNKCQSEVKSLYKPSIEVLVNNKFYLVESFRIP